MCRVKVPGQDELDIGVQWPKYRLKPWQVRFGRTNPKVPTITLDEFDKKWEGVDIKSIKAQNRKDQRAKDTRQHRCPYCGEQVS